jgi:exonuclease SbcC
LKRATAERDKCLDAHKLLKEQRAQLPFADKQGAKAAVDARAALEHAIEIAELSAKSAASQLESIKREIAKVKEQIASQKSLRNDIKKLKAEEALHEVAQRELRSLRQTLNNEIRPELEALASENLEILTNGRYFSLKLNDMFEPSLIEDDGTAKPVISGGEEDVTALALRIALSELIQERNGRPMSLLILDEVFGSLDMDRRQAVLERLTSLKGRFHQILVISHIEEINRVADQCLYVWRNESTGASIARDVPMGGFDPVS